MSGIICLFWNCENFNLSVYRYHYAKGITTLKYATRDALGVIEYLDLECYDWATYQTNAGLGEISVVIWLGVSHKVVQLMSYWIIIVTGRFISCATVQRLASSEMAAEEFQKQMQFYDEHIKNKLETVGTDSSVSSMIGIAWPLIKMIHTLMCNLRDP